MTFVSVTARLYAPAQESCYDGLRRAGAERSARVLGSSTGGVVAHGTGHTLTVNCPTHTHARAHLSPAVTPLLRWRRAWSGAERGLLFSSGVVGRLASRASLVRAGKHTRTKHRPNSVGPSDPKRPKESSKMHKGGSAIGSVARLVRRSPSGILRKRPLPIPQNCVQRRRRTGRTQALPPTWLHSAHCGECNHIGGVL